MDLKLLLPITIKTVKYMYTASTNLNVVARFNLFLKFE